MADERPHDEDDELDELEAKLSEFDSKVRDAGHRRMPDVPDWNYARPKTGPGAKPDYSDKQNYRGMGMGIFAAYLLGGSMVVGWGIGWLIDVILREKDMVFRPILGIAGALGGIALVVMYSNRDSNR